MWFVSLSIKYEQIENRGKKTNKMGSEFPFVTILKKNSF